jgi:methyl-accepting chemotaxis protein
MGGLSEMVYTTINSVRVGGEGFTNIVNQKDLLADVLPPPVSLLSAIYPLHRMAAEPSKVNVYLPQYEAWRKDYAVRCEYRQKTITNAHDAEGVKVARSHIDRFNELMDTVYLPQVKNGKFDELDKALDNGELNKEYDLSIAAINDLATSVQKSADEDVVSVSSHAVVARNQIVGITVGTSFLVLVLNLLIGRSIIRPLAAMLTKIRDMTSGSRNLTQRLEVDGKDELTEVSGAFNTFVDQLVASQEESRRQSTEIERQAAELSTKASELVKATNAMSQGDFTVEIAVAGGDAIGEIGDGLRSAVSQIGQLIREATVATTRVDTGTTQIASASQSLAASASEQAASLEEISASLEEMSGMTRQNADNAQQAAALANSATESADRGKTETVQLGGAMKDIQESATKISQIIKTIDEIAFQTNLLALNAAVEAARAGEAGKGFAVVAEEVRNLAQRSADAAKSTASMIEEARKRADNGAAIGSRVGNVLEQICSGNAKVSTLLSEIAASSREQATGISQITKGVGELDKVTQQNAGNSEELAAAAQESSSQMAGLTATLSRFHVDGSDSPAPTLKTTHSSGGDSRQRQTTTRSSHAGGRVAGTTAAAAKNAIPFGEHEETFEKF